jgi:thymidylate synthase (FAD)
MTTIEPDLKLDPVNINFIKPSCSVLFPYDHNVGDNALYLIERAGRTCYKSESDMTRETAEKFFRKMFSSGHLSVIEHFSITGKFVTNRGVTHEMVRHRLASFSQESTRYVNYSKKGEYTIILPLWYRDMKDSNKNHIARKVWLNSMYHACQTYETLMNKGRKAQEARGVLPNDLKTEIIITANIREWRHIFNLRCAPAAHPEMREIMKDFLFQVADLIPVAFDDLIEPFK